MADQITQNIGLTLPTPGGDNNTWGDILNEDLSIIDTEIGVIETSVTTETTRAQAVEALKVDTSALSVVATSGLYTDLIDIPTTASQLNSDWNATSGLAEILNKPTIPTIPTLSTVATTGSYTDLSNKPTIPPSQVQTDWNAISGVSQILNKPTIPSVVNFSDNEIPSGTIDGVNSIFTLVYIPVINSVKLYKNGQRLAYTIDFTVSSNTITMITIINTLDVFIVDYRY